MPDATRPLSRCYLRSYLVKILQELTKIPARNTRTIFEHRRARATSNAELNMSTIIIKQLIFNPI